MKIRADINNIKAKMVINENTYLRRRVSPERLEDEFTSALDDATYRYKKNKEKWNLFSSEKFANLVIAFLMDELHPTLINPISDSFPYDEIYNYLMNRYMDRILIRYLDISE